jgi:hypothetical protein
MLPLQSAPRGCTGDGGRSPGVGLQEQAPNHLKLLWSKARVVSVKEKIWHRTMSGEIQGDERKRTTDEVSKTSTADVKIGRLTLLQDKSRGEPVYCLGGVRHRGGVPLNQASVWNAGTCRSDAKGETRVEDPPG